ncbi:hypothetical protein BDF22DRAFT_694274 [Syncephalis plumigaleata]|nr:hypothetical protein BDF22DRAFT_694274 [Syncephalis plumigaleata]
MMTPNLVSSLFVLFSILSNVLLVENVVEASKNTVAASNINSAMPLFSGIEPLEAIRGHLRSSTIDVTVTFYSGGNLPYGRVYITTTRLDANDRAVYLLKLHESPLASSIDLSAMATGGNTTSTVSYCQGINGVYDPDYRYPNQPQQVIPMDTGNAPKVSEASLMAWNGLEDNGESFKESDFVPDRENIVNTWRTVVQPPKAPPSDSPKYRCRPGRFGSCMLGDLSASLNATLSPPTQNVTSPYTTVSLHPRLETRQGRRAFINYSLALHQINQPQVVYACTNLAPLDVKREPEPISSPSRPPTIDGIWRVTIVLYFALINVIYSSVLLHRDRQNPARWLLLSHRSSYRLLCTGSVAGVLLVKAYYGHKRAYWVAIVGVCVEIVVVALLTYNATRAYSNDVNHLPNDGCLAPYVLFGISAETFYSKIVIDVLSNLLCSGLFLAVHSARVYDALARDGIIFLVCACASSIFCPILYVSQALPPFITNTLYSIDYVVASTLIVQQLLRGEAVRQQRKAETAAVARAAHKRSDLSPKSQKRTLRFNTAASNHSKKSNSSNMKSSYGQPQRLRRPTFASNFTGGGRKPNRDSDISLWTDIGANNTFFSATSTNMSCLNEEDMDQAVDIAIRLKEARERANSNLQQPPTYPDSPSSLGSMAGASLLDVPPAYQVNDDMAEVATPSRSNGSIRQRVRDSIASRRTKYLSALSFVRPLNNQHSFESNADDKIEVVRTPVETAEASLQQAQAQASSSSLQSSIIRILIALLIPSLS